MSVDPFDKLCHLDHREKMYLKNNYHIKEILEGTRDINEPDSDGKTAVYNICQRYNKYVGKILFSLDPDVNIPNHDGTYPLHMACKSGTKGLIEQLHKKGAIVTVRDKYQRTPLHFAASYNTKDVVEYLLEINCELEAVDFEGSTAVHYAAMRPDGHVILAVLIEQKGTSIKTQNNYGKYPLHYATSSNVLSFFIQHTENLNLVDKENKTALHYLSSIWNKGKQVEMLLNHKIEIDILDNHGRSALLYACKESSVETVRVLLSHMRNTKSKINHKDHQNNTALHYACQRFDGLPLVKFLIANEADLNAKNVYGNTAVMEAIKSQVIIETDILNTTFENIISCLFEAGADLNITNRQGQTPIHLLFRFSGMSVIKWFLNYLQKPSTIMHKSQLQVKDVRKRLVLHYAAENRNPKIFEKLLETQKNVNSRDIDGKTALHCGGKHLDENAVATFVHCGGNVNISDQYEKTPLDIAVAECNTSLIRGLLQNGGMLGDTGYRNRYLIHLITPNIILQSSEHSLFLGASYVASIYEMVVKNEMLKMFLVRHRILKKTSIGRTTALHRACEKNIIDEVILMLHSEDGKRLLNEKTEIMKKSALHIASENGNTSLVYILSLSGADLDQKDIADKTALHISVEKDHRSIVHLLLQHGADINLQDKMGRTPLHISIAKNQYQLTSILLQHGASTEMCDKEGQKPSFYSKNKDINFLLQQHKDEIDRDHATSAGSEDQASDIQSEKMCLLEMTKRHVSSAEYVYIPSEQGRRRIHVLKQSKTFEFGEIKFLVYVQNSTNANAVAYGYGLVKYACLYLCSCFSSIKPIDIFKQCYDLYAVLANHISRFYLPAFSEDDSKLYIQKRIENRQISKQERRKKSSQVTVIYSRDKKGKDASIYDLINKYDYMPTDLYELLQSRVWLSSLDKDDNTFPVSAIHKHIARKNWHDAYTYLRKQKSPNIQDNLGWTPLHHCILHDMMEFVVLLVHNNADVNIQTKDILPFKTPSNYTEKGLCRNISPLLLATILDRRDIIKILANENIKIDLQKCLKLSFGEDTETEILKGICLQLERKYLDISLRVYPGSMQAMPLKRILLGISTQVFQTINTEFMSMDVQIRNPNFYDNKTDKTDKIETFLTAAEGNLLKRVIKDHASNLWLCHSSLNGISGTALQINSNRSKEKSKRHPYIVLYTSIKEFIPLHERIYPTYLNACNDQVGVILREGNSTFGPSSGGTSRQTNLKHLRMGSSIGMLNGKSGTIGPFVKLEGDNVGFISCAHVFFENEMKANRYVRFDEKASPNENVFVVKPTDDEIKKTLETEVIDVHSEDYRNLRRLYAVGGDQDVENDGLSPEQWRNCGEIVKAEFDSGRDIGIDAALIRITKRKPIDGSFTKVSRDNLMAAGDFTEPPNFHSGKDIKTIQFSDYGAEVIKFGASTEITGGRLLFDSAQVKLTTSAELAFPCCSRYVRDLKCDTHQKDRIKFVMKGQYEIESQKGNNFFSPGDSGAGVFTVNRKKNNELTCLGIAIGLSTDRTTIVTPIRSVLSALGDVELKQFSAARKRRYTDAFSSN